MLGPGLFEYALIVLMVAIIVFAIAYLVLDLKSTAMSRTLIAHGSVVCPFGVYPYRELEILQLKLDGQWVEVDRQSLIKQGCSFGE
jgi:hypothetical protein